MTEPAATPAPAAQPTAATAAPAPAEPATPASWDELFKDEDPAKVKEALEHSRKWEQRAKDNKKRLDEAAPKIAEYDKLAAASQTELERAQNAATEAQAKVQAANNRAVKAQVRLLAASDFVDPDVPFAFLDPNKYVTDDGVDEDSLKADLAELLTSRPTLAKPAGSRVPAPNPAQGSSASGAPDLDAQIKQAQEAGDYKTAIHLQNQKLAPRGA